MTIKYEEIIQGMHELIKYPGLNVAVYTQMTDIETENNGLITYAGCCRLALFVILKTALAAEESTPSLLKVDSSSFCSSE